MSEHEVDRCGDCERLRRYLSAALTDLRTTRAALADAQMEISEWRAIAEGARDSLQWAIDELGGFGE